MSQRVCVEVISTTHTNVRQQALFFCITNCSTFW